MTAPARLAVVHLPLLAVPVALHCRVASSVVHELPAGEQALG